LSVLVMSSREGNIPMMEERYRQDPERCLRSGNDRRSGVWLNTFGIPVPFLIGPSYGAQETGIGVAIACCGRCNHTPSCYQVRWPMVNLSN
jgi:hypothetical protein